MALTACTIDWQLLGPVLEGVGTLLLGAAAVATLFIQYGFRRKAKKYEAALSLLLTKYREFMAQDTNDDRIVWADYPENADAIVNGISKQTGLDPDLTRQLLNKLHSQGKLQGIS